MVLRQVRNGDQQIAVPVQGDVAVHHAAEADGADGLERDVVLGSHVLGERSIALLQAGPDIVQAVGPDAVFVLVFPVVAARRNRRVIVADQHGLDTRRTELDAQRGFAALDGGLDVGLVHGGLLLWWRISVWFYDTSGQE